MLRYIIVSLLIGCLAAALVLTLFFAGLFSGLEGFLGRMYGAAGFFPIGHGGTADRDWLEAGIVLASAIAAAWCVVDIPQISHKMLVCLTLAAVVLGLSPTLALWGIVFEPVSSLVAIALAAAGGLFYAGTEQGMRKRVLEDVLGSRVSPEVFRRLLDAREPIKLSGEIRDTSVLTCRVFNHAELRQKMEPADLLAMSNLFLRTTSDFLLSRGAYLDESSPDLIRVYFGMLDSKSEKHHAESACLTALDLKKRLKNLNDECDNRWFQRLQFGVAVSSGPMTVGVYGSPQHFHFSGVGSETDFSRRLAHANLRYGSDVLIGAQTYQLVQDKVEVRPMEMLYDPSRNLMSEVYQVLAPAGEFTQMESDRRDAFWNGVILYRKGEYQEALKHFAGARMPGQDDGPVSFFIEQAEARLKGEDASRREHTHELTEKGHARLLNLM